MNAQLLEYFNHRYDELLATMKKAKRLSSNTKGLAREGGVKAFLEEILPPMVRVESGDIIDAEGNRSGSLDAVLLHHAVPSLSMASGTRHITLMIAEAVVAAVEVKSDLPHQWAEVVSTWKQLIPIKRMVTTERLFTHMPPRPENEIPITQRSVPLVVFAHRGWKNRKTVEAKAETLGSLFVSARKWYRPLNWIVTLDPPMFCRRCYSFDESTKMPYTEYVAFSPPFERRGLILGRLWAQLSQEAAGVPRRDIPWYDYVGEEYRWLEPGRKRTSDGE